MKIKSLILTVIPNIIAVSLLATFCLLCGCSKIKSNFDPNTSFKKGNIISDIGEIKSETRAAYIASVYNINFPSAPDLTEEQLKSELDSIVTKSLDAKINTLYFQVHPSSDSLYNSKSFPVSKFLYSDGSLKFDVLKYMSEKCKEVGIDLYAWFNPLRVSTKQFSTKADALADLPNNSPAKNENLVVFYGDGKLYFDCGNKDVRELIAGEVEYVLKNYDVSGVIFDDYFYPYPKENCEFDDSDSYRLSASKKTIDDWRRENVNELIKNCHDVALKYEKTFGVAPFGIWQNNDGENNGSATSGFESYNSLYSDSVYWIKNNLVDFISPQLYWKTTDSAASFTVLCDWWDKLAGEHGVDLIISHAAYMYDGWDSPSGEITSQVEYAQKLPSYVGSAYYGFEEICTNTFGIRDELKVLYSNDTYYFCSTDSDTDIVSASSIFDDGTKKSVKFSGYCSPDEKLTVNGIEITPDSSGYFVCILELTEEENRFDFIYGEEIRTILIKNK